VVNCSFLKVLPSVLAQDDRLIFVEKSRHWGNGGIFPYLSHLRISEASYFTPILLYLWASPRAAANKEFVKSASYTCTPVGVGETKNCQLVRRLQRTRDPSTFSLRLWWESWCIWWLADVHPLGMHRFAILGKYFLIQKQCWQGSTPMDIISKMGSRTSRLENTHTRFRSLRYLYQEVEQVVTFK